MIMMLLPLRSLAPTHYSASFSPPLPSSSRLKDVAQQQYSQDEAEAAAGMTKEVLPSVHGSGSVVVGMVS